MVELLLAAVLLALMAGLVADTARLGAPPMPSSPAERRAVLDLLRHLSAESTAPLRIVEAGAGWGGLAARIARELPDADVLAVEAAVIPIACCTLRARLGGTFRVRWGDARRCSLDSPDVVVAFLGPEATAALAERLLRDHPHVRVVSVGFALRGWTKTARIRLADSWSTEVAIWTPPRAPKPGSPPELAQPQVSRT